MTSLFFHNLYAKVVVILGTFFTLALMIMLSNSIYNNNTPINENIVIVKPDMFKNITLEAKAAFVWDVKRQKALYGLNEESQLPLASLTKLATAVTALEILPIDSIVTIDKESLGEEGDSGLYENEKWDFKSLVSYTLVVSSNDGASAIANIAGLFENNFPKRETGDRKTFINSMNEKVSDIGLTQTYFINSTGLDTNQIIGGGYGSAHDVAKLLEYAILNNSEVVESTRYAELEFTSLSSINHSAINTNSGISTVPGLIASKTGFTDLAGGNLVVAFDAGLMHPIIISILGSTKEGRFRDVEKLVNASLLSLD